MAQFARPDGDLTVGLWTSTPLWQKIDETPFDDADFIQSVNDPTNDMIEVTLSDVTDPVSSIDHVVRYRIRKGDSGGGSPGTIDFRIELVQETILIFRKSEPGVGTSFFNGTFTLNNIQADDITDYNDLRLTFRANKSAGNRTSWGECSFAEFEVPDAGGTNFTETVTEAVGVTDSTPIEQGKERIEAVGITDEVSRVHDAARIRIEAVGITDEINVEQSKRIEETVGITDTVLPAKSITVVITEAIGVTDETPIEQGKVIEEAVGVGDVVLDDLSAAGFEETVTEAVGITDTVLPAKSITVVIEEAIGITDDTPIEQSKVITESVGITDDTPIEQSKVITESVGITDDTPIEQSKVITEAIGISDTTSRVVDAARVIAEGIGLTDDTTRIIDWTRVIAEGVGITDDTIPFLPTAGVLDLQALAVGYVGGAFARIAVGEATTRIAVGAPQRAITLKPVS